MTPRQIELARHALGLPNDNRRSYRNRFIAGLDHHDFPFWQAMVLQGDADFRKGEKLPFGGDWIFWLTPQGARAALLPGERLCPEDFPDA